MGRYDFSGGLQPLILSYSEENREVRIFLLDTTDTQDTAMVDFISKNPSGGIDRDGSVAANNCATSVCNALEAGEVVSSSSVGRQVGIYSPEFIMNAILSGDIAVKGEVLFELNKILKEKQEKEEEAPDDEEMPLR